MSQNRIEQQLHARISAGGKSLLPYLTAGFPDMATTMQLIRRCDQAGCTAVEIGFPFSDSIADGPVIQDSFYRALDAGFRVDDLFEAVADIRAEVSAGLIAMVSMSLLAKRGTDAFIARAAQAGFDGLIVPDVPVDEAAQLSAEAGSAGLCNILMEAPTSSTARREWIASRSRGFLYVIASRGITGERSTVSTDLAAHLGALRSLTDTPLIVGFGISTPEHVREVCRHADGVIVGSAIIRRITEAASRQASTGEIVESIGGYLDTLMAATG
jgi:tryptophan synthase alpha chain